LPNDDDFTGAKIALISQGMLIAYKRDMKPSIPFPGMWDLPGGGREGSETAVECALRETWEEFGLRIDASSIVWERRYASQRAGGLASYFLVANLAEGAFDAITFETRVNGGR
jgi:8-oxo-dGTP diphosphatase